MREAQIASDCQKLNSSFITDLIVHHQCLPNSMVCDTLGKAQEILAGVYDACGAGANMYEYDRHNDREDRRHNRARDRRRERRAEMDRDRDRDRDEEVPPTSRFKDLDEVIGQVTKLQAASLVRGFCVA